MEYRLAKMQNKRVRPDRNDSERVFTHFDLRKEADRFDETFERNKNIGHCRRETN